jgi:hypothetical protein
MNHLWSLAVLLAAAGPAAAGTFEPRPVAPELGLDALTRGVARERIGRDLFARPYATATLGRVDVYPVFPYVESRTFQIVSDPAWNRLVYGEAGRTLRAFDGRGSAFGPLDGPRGLSVDDRDRVYVADAGNDRVLVLQASTEFGDITLSPLYEIRGLHDPHDVVHSDAGTPFRAEDDLLYVADTGANQVLAFRLVAGAAEPAGAVGGLGSGTGRFAGPMAVAVGRAGGAHTRDVYVSDAHSGRIVRLRHENGAFLWVDQTDGGAGLVTALSTDEWGNLYAAAPQSGRVRKFSPDLSPVADLAAGLSRPRAFDVPVLSVTDHRTGTASRSARPVALSVEDWTDRGGIRLWGLGVEVAELTVTGGGSPAACFLLTDRAQVSLEIADAADGRVLSRRSAGLLDAGRHAVALAGGEVAAAEGRAATVRIVAASAYPDGPTGRAETALGPAGLPAPPAQPLLAAGPNPARGPARITFVVPSGAVRRTTLRVYDTSGRLVRHLGGAFAPGLHEVVWDGRSDRGAQVPAGVYFCRLDLDDRSLTRSLALAP